MGREEAAREGLAEVDIASYCTQDNRLGLSLTRPPFPGMGDGGLGVGDERGRLDSHITSR